MFNALGVMLQIAQGVGLVNATPFVEQVEGVMYRYASNLMATLLKLMQYFFLVLTLLTTAAGLYTALYRLIMPAKLHEKNLYFDYGLGDCTPANMEVCNMLPQTTVDFLYKHNQWDGTRMTKVHYMGDRVLTPERGYMVDLEFELPDNAANIDIGPWMVQVELLTSKGELLARSSRPLLLKYHSRIIKLVRTLLMVLPVTMGLSLESQTLKVNCFDWFQESMDNPLAKARVSLSTRRIQLYEARLSISAQLNWVQYMMHDWFYTTASVVILFIACMEGAIIGFIYFWAQLSLEESQVQAEHASLEGKQGEGAAFYPVPAIHPIDGNKSDEVQLIGSEDHHSHLPITSPTATTSTSFVSSSATTATTATTSTTITTLEKKVDHDDDDEEEARGRRSPPVEVVSNIPPYVRSQTENLRRRPAAQQPAAPSVIQQGFFTNDDDEELLS